MTKKYQQITEEIIQNIREISNDDYLTDELIKMMRIIAIDQEEGSCAVIVSIDRLGYESLRHSHKYRSFIHAAIERTLNTEVSIIFEVIGANEHWERDDEEEVAECNDEQHFSDYVYAPFNRQLMSAHEWIFDSEKLGQGFLSPVFLHSKSGMGKTFFLESIRKCFDVVGKRVIFIRGNELKNNLAQVRDSAEYSSRLAELRELHKNCDVLLIDDVQLLGNQEDILAELFTVISHLIEKKRHIIITADSPPEYLVGFKDRLITRFKGGLNIPILKIDNKSSDVLFKFFAEKYGLRFVRRDMRQIRRFAWKNFADSVRAIEGAFRSLSLYQKRLGVEHIRYDDVREFYRERGGVERECNPTIIIEETSKFFKLPIERILKPGARSKKVSMARNIAIYTAAQILKPNLTKLGQYFGLRSHTTVVSAVRKIHVLSEENSAVKTAIIVVRRNVDKRRKTNPGGVDGESPVFS